MAVWKSENSMLTQVGVEILNKIKSGNGSIVVTRVVAGSNRVPASTLYRQTGLGSVQNELVINKVITEEGGSEISCVLTNTGYLGSFALHQIGIFVTHPDYAGEQLYHISQCEEEGYDLIPAERDAQVSLGYSLFLEHGNSDSIELTVDPTGMITREEFDAFKEDLFDNDHFLKTSGGNVSGPVVFNSQGKQVVLGGANGGAEINRDDNGNMSFTNYMDEDQTERRVFRIYGTESDLESCLKLAVRGEDGVWRHYTLYGEHNKHLISRVLEATVLG